VSAALQRKGWAVG